MYYSGKNHQQCVFEGNSNFSNTCARLVTEGLTPVAGLVRINKWALSLLNLVTKSTNVRNLLEIASSKQVIVSFSLNAKPIAERWEKKAPPVEKRIEAAKKLSDAGYEVRIRIDPMVPIESWRESYIELIDEIFLRFIPERITLGSLRGLQSTINGTKDTSWVKYLKEGSNWGKKIDFTTRHRMYTAIIEHLGNRCNYHNVALCKETKAMWEKLGINWSRIRCNCVW